MERPHMLIKKADIVLKKYVHTQMVYSFQSVPIKTPMMYFLQLEKIILEFAWMKRDQKQTKGSRDITAMQSHQNTHIQNITQSNNQENSIMLAIKYTQTRVDGRYREEATWLQLFLFLLKGQTAREMIKSLKRESKEYKKNLQTIVLRGH